MEKILILESKTTPDAWGYPDRYALYAYEGGELLAQGAARCGPNPREPVRKGSRPWDQCYGWIACGTYRGVVQEHMDSRPDSGACIKLENGVEVPSRVPNPNHNGRRVLDHVYVHRGDTDTWPGSAGCITIPPDEHPRLFGRLAVGDTVSVTVLC